MMAPLSFSFAAGYGSIYCLCIYAYSSIITEPKHATISLKSLSFHPAL